MKRGIITNNGQDIYISDGEVWMTSWEIAALLYTTAGTIHAAIKRILKANVLKATLCFLSPTVCSELHTTWCRFLSYSLSLSLLIKANLLSMPIQIPGTSLKKQRSTWVLVAKKRNKGTNLWPVYIVILSFSFGLKSGDQIFLATYVSHNDKNQVCHKH